MTEKEYRSHPAISRSDLWMLRESPQKFKWAMEHPTEPTPALVFGQLLHTMLLEPEKLKERYAIVPMIDRRTKEGKAQHQAFVEQSAGKTIVTADMVEQAQGMCEAIKAEPMAVKLLDGEREKPFFWTDEMTGECCKSRVDVYNTRFSQPIIVDVKTTQDASTDAFIKSAVRYGYDFQAAMYSDGVQNVTGEKPLFVFIAVEKEPPYAVNILQADDAFIDRGYEIFRQLIGTYHECKQSGNWYGYLGEYNQINSLSLPQWLLKEV